MLEEGIKVALVGFSTVFLTLIILEVSVNLMSFFIKRFGKKEGK